MKHLKDQLEFLNTDEVESISKDLLDDLNPINILLDTDLSIMLEKDSSIDRHKEIIEDTKSKYSALIFKHLDKILDTYLKD